MRHLPSTSASEPAKRKLSRRRKLLYSASLCGLTFLVLVALGEIYVRHTTTDTTGWYELTDDPILFYRLRGPVAGDDEGRRRTQTGQYLRGANGLYARHPAEGVFRVLWLGDSACFGCGCDDEETAPAYFQRLAAERGVAAESMNLAVVGYNVRQVREVLARRSKEFEGAGAVVYYHHENDIVNAPIVELAPRMPRALYWEYEAPQPYGKNLIKRSALVRRLWNTDLAVRLRHGAHGGVDSAAMQAALHDRERVLPIHGFTRECIELYDDETELGRRFRSELQRMNELAAAVGARLIFVYWPSRTLLHHAELDRLRQTLEAWCVADSIVFVDVTEAFLEDHRFPGVYCDSIHPGPGGQRIIAEAVADSILGRH